MVQNQIYAIYKIISPIIVFPPFIYNFTPLYLYENQKED